MSLYNAMMLANEAAFRTKKKLIKKKKRHSSPCGIHGERKESHGTRPSPGRPRQDCPRSVFSVSENVSVLWQSPQTSPELLSWASRMTRHLAAPWAPSRGAPSPASPDRHLEVTLIHWTREWLVGFLLFCFVFILEKKYIYIYINR